MTIGEHKATFAGLPAREWQAGTKAVPGTAWRVATHFDGDAWTDVFAEFMSSPGVEQIEVLLVGNWSTDVDEGQFAGAAVAALVAAAPRLQKLRGLFFGDIIMEENEISWIHNTDITPLLKAFPSLRDFGVRGGQDLELPDAVHEQIEELTIETGGLPSSVVRQVIAARLPKLVRLELWLGDEGYGRDTEVEDLQPLLRGECFPGLRHLGMRNADNMDEVAAAVAGAAIIERLESLDLSLGTLTDEGAKALLGSVAVKRLRSLDLHHHYLTPEMQQRLLALGPKVDVSNGLDPNEEYRCPAVSE